MQRQTHRKRRELNPHSGALKTALAHAAAGRPVLPCRNKKPLTRHGFKDATTDEATIRRWWRENPDAQVGLRTGEASGVDVLDLDKKKGKNGFAFVPGWEQLSPVIARTGSGGAHVYFKHASGLRKSIDEIAPGVDVLADGAYAVLPPSAGYNWVNGSDFSKLPSWPNRLLQLAQRKPKPDGVKLAEPTADIGRVTLALAVIPNNDVGWDEWNNRGMATWRATGGNAAGFEAFDAWSQKSKKYDADAVRERWTHYPNSPPTEIGAGTIFFDAARVSPLDYERERELVAKLFRVRVSVLDRFYADMRREHANDGLQGEGLELPEITPCAEAVDGRQMLADMIEAIRRHVVLTRHQAIAVSLWVIHSHLLDRASHSPRLHVSSPVRRCGKSVLLDTVKPMVQRAAEAENISTAVLFRIIQKYRPTLLIDEVDGFLNGENREELRSLLNAGHKPDGAVYRVAGDDHEVRKFSVWAPVVLCGIGEIPQTLEDRSITIHLRRRLPKEQIERLTRKAKSHLKLLGCRIARWVEDNRSALSRDDDPEMPEELNDRAMDNWRPLVAIADLIGASNRARGAATGIAAEEFVEEPGSSLILGDVAAIFAKYREDWLPSSRIVLDLVGLQDRPWAEWRRGKPLNQWGLARLLKPFGVRKDKHRINGKPVNAYERKVIDEAANRYAENAADEA